MLRSKLGDGIARSSKTTVHNGLSTFVRSFSTYIEEKNALLYTLLLIATRKWSFVAAALVTYSYDKLLT